MRKAYIGLKFISRSQLLFLGFLMLAVSPRSWADNTDTTVPAVPIANVMGLVPGASSTSSPQETAVKSQVNSPVNLLNPNSSGGSSNLEKAGIYSIGGKLFLDRDVQVQAFKASTITASGITVDSATINSSENINGNILLNGAVGTTSNYLNSQGAGVAPQWSCKGLVLNVATATVSGTQDTTTSSYPTWVNTSLTITYTARLSTSLLLIQVTGAIGHGTANHNVYTTIGVGSGTPATAISGASVARVNINAVAGDVPFTTEAMYYPSSSGATVYRALFSSDGGTASFGDTNVTERIRIEEICQQ